MKIIKESQPGFLAEQENLALLKKKLQDVNIREEEGKVKRNTILKLKLESLNSKITDLTTTLAAVKEAKLLSDNKVRHILSNLSRWESAIEKIKENKEKIDKDSVEATVNNEEIVKLKSVFNKLCGIFDGVKTDLTTADKD